MGTETVTEMEMERGVIRKWLLTLKDRYWVKQFGVMHAWESQLECYAIAFGRLIELTFKEAALPPRPLGSGFSRRIFL